MESIRKVLLAADGTTHSTHAARFLAALLPHDGSVEVDVLTVLSYGVYPERNDEGGPAAIDRGEAIDGATREAVAILDAAGIKARVSHLYGSPAEGIIEQCRNLEPDLIVLGSRGLRGAAGLFGASVSRRVFRETNRPVLVVPLTETPAV